MSKLRYVEGYVKDFLLWNAKKTVAFFVGSVYIVVSIEWKVYAVNDVNNRVLVAEF